jgi:hypothetical protein
MNSDSDLELLLARPASQAGLSYASQTVPSPETALAAEMKALEEYACRGLRRPRLTRHFSALNAPHVPFRKKRASETAVKSANPAKKARVSDEQQVELPDLEAPVPSTSKVTRAASAKPATDKAAAKRLKASEVAAEKTRKKERQEDNKLVNAKKDVMHEIVVAFSANIKRDVYFAQVLEPLSDLLRGDEDTKPSRYVLAVAGTNGAKIVRWERFTHRYFDEVSQQWIRYTDGRLRRYYETFAALLMTAAEFDEVYRGDRLLQTIAQVRRDVGLDDKAHQFFILVDGLDGWSKSRPRGGSTVEQMEQNVYRVSLAQTIGIIPTSGPDDVARWLHELSMEIAYRPYK